MHLCRNKLLSGDICLEEQLRTEFVLPTEVYHALSTSRQFFFLFLLKVTVYDSVLNNNCR